jgi:hypothetical protein
MLDKTEFQIPNPCKRSDSIFSRVPRFSDIRNEEAGKYCVYLKRILNSNNCINIKFIIKGFL